MAISTTTPNGSGRKIVPFSLTDTKAHTITKPNIKIPPTTDRVDRTSFSSIKESHLGGVAQTFTDSKTSSYLRHQYPSEQDTFIDEDAILDDASSSSSGTKTPERKAGMLTNPHSVLHGFVCPCDSFKGWKGISIKGRIASKSYGDLKGLGMRYDWETRGGEKVEVGGEGKKKIVMVKGRFPAGQSPFERLPMELLGAIIDQLSTDIPPNGFTPRNIDLMSLLLTSRSLHTATLTTLYSQITIPHSRIFRKFLSHIKDHPSLGTIVRRLDFSHFNPTGAGQTARERAQTLNLIPATLLQCLTLTPNLREFLAQEHIDDDLSSSVLNYLLTSLPHLKALDFCACSSASFLSAFNTVISSPLPDFLPITRLSFHECTILPSSIYATLLPRLKHLTHLDVAHTRITASALQSIPTTAKLTHLNLSKCSSLLGSDVADFLSTHPAAKTLVYLNLGMDVKSAEMLSPEDLERLLPVLPQTLKSLNLKGSKMGKEHIPLLLPLTKHLEELALGRHLDLASILPIFRPPPSQDSDSDVDVDVDEMEIDREEEWIPPTLHYLDISDLSPADLDLSTLFSSSCPILSPLSLPLEVLELSSQVYKKVENSSAVKRVGWCGKEAGRRGWLVREHGETSEGVKGGKGDGMDVKEGRDNGSREWKWGASSWGMRKVPVARAEVGGMYGHYMFKR